MSARVLPNNLVIHFEYTFIKYKSSVKKHRAEREICMNTEFKSNKVIIEISMNKSLINCTQF